MPDSPDSNATIDPLLECLVFLTSHYGRTKSAQALVSGLAYGDGDMRPELFCEAAERVNLKSKIVKPVSYTHLRAHETDS